MTTRFLCNRVAVIGRGMGHSDRLLLAAAADIGHPPRRAIVGKREFADSKALPSSLPKLPVPPLQDTLQKFLQMTKPLQTSEQHTQTQKEVSMFLNDKQSQHLQQLLEQRSMRLPNWLTPWWLDAAYLEARTPLPIVTSPGVVFPPFDFTGLDGHLKHAARLTQAALRFQKMVLSKQLPQEKSGSHPFDMSQYDYLFGTIRLPKLGKDQLRYGNAVSPPPKHITVLHNGNVFEMDVLDSSGQMLSIDQLIAQFRVVLAECPQLNAHPLGMMTAGDRDQWARVYERVKGSHQKQLSSIEESLFVVCLDQPTQYENKRDEQALQALHGGGSRKNSRNRWFDKTLQFIVGHEGASGLTYEHTPAEGPPLANLMDFICDRMDKLDFSNTACNGQFASPKHLEFKLTAEDQAKIEQCSNEFDKTIAGLELRSVTFEHFGKKMAKAAKLSPDSLIQVAFQMAHYRLHGTHPPIYETATLRRFQDGRTDTIRLPNAQSARFVEQFNRNDPNVSARMLREAIEQHKEYSLQAMSGRGIDRHLLGLRMTARDHNMPIPELFSSAAYQQLMHFQVSTSQVPTRHFIQMCFGPFSDDCYGCCYNPQENEIHFTITAYTPHRSAEKFWQALQQCLLDMRQVLELSDSMPPPRSKL